MSQFLTIGLLMLLATLLPGPAFAVVTTNTLLYSRRSGLFTSLGVGCALLVHIFYCALGLAIVISQSLFIFNLIKYIGAVFLFYLGISLLIIKTPPLQPDLLTQHSSKSIQSSLTSFWQGFLGNLFNPKTTAFFLALFTAVISPDTSAIWLILFAIEMFLIATSWYSFVVIVLSHRRVVKILDKAEKYIAKSMGILLIGFAVVLAGVHIY